MKNKIKTVCVAASLTLASYAPIAQAEPGDFGFWTTLGNLFSPDKANRPVTQAETQGLYPLTLDDPNFNDDFSPGSYDNWQKIDVPVSTGAMCGNGSPYKFFVYRVPDTSNTLFYLEGGGACWDYESCSGQAGIRGARNPNGIPDDYVQNINLLDFQNLSNLGTAGASPLIYTHHPYNQFKTGEWNIVYVPYCTGDIYVGDKTEVYEDPTGQNPDLVFHHNGVRNMQSVVSWVRNNLKKPKQLAVGGCSAGSVGALLNYSKVAEDMDTDYGYLIDDSGPIFNAPRSTGDTASYPHIPLQTQVLDVWTTFDPQDTVSENPVNLLVSKTPGLDSDNLGSIYQALSNKFPDYRLGITHFLADGNFSSYSYERFYPDIFEDPDADSRLNKLRETWQFDTANNLVPILDQTDNWHYYFPLYRDFNESHCTTVLDFRYGEIEEANLDLYDFLNNLVKYNGGAPIRAVETDPISDYINNHDLFYDLIGGLL